MDLKDKLHEFNRLYNVFKEKNDTIKDPLEKYQDASRFMEDNRKLVREIEDLNLVVLEHKKKLKDRDICKNFMDDVSRGNSAKNYDKLEKLASQMTEHMHYTDIDDIFKSYPEQNMLYELNNLDKTNKENLENQLSGLKPYIKKRDILTTIALIKDMTDKDKEYKRRGFFGQMWYAKSYQRMMATRDKLINELSSKGVYDQNIKKIWSQDNVDMGKLAQEMVETVRQHQIGQIKNLKDLYRIYITSPKDLIDDIKKEVEKKETTKNISKNKAMEIKEEMFAKFKEKNPEMFIGEYEKFKASDVEALQNMKIKEKFDDAFKKYRDDPANQKEKVALEIAYKDYKEKSDEIKYLNEEIKARETALKKGKDFNQNEFADKMKKMKENEGKSLTSRLETDTNSTQTNNNKFKLENKKEFIREKGAVNQNQNKSK